VLKVLTLAGGLLLAGGGAGCGLLYVLLPLFYREPDLLPTNLTIASLAAITLTLGVALAFQARASLKGQPSGNFRPPSGRALGLLFIACLLIGQVLISFAGGSPANALIFPPIHILAAVSPALAILAYVGRRTGAASWRTISLEVSHGALLAPLGALVAELIVIVGLVVAISMVVVFTPGGAERLWELSAHLQDPAWVENPENLVPLLLSPAALVIILLVFVIIAPLIEEFLKALGVLLLGYRLRGRAEALLWGVACGAGFALTESLFNGSIALEGWGAVMLMRWGASLMHCVSSGILGLGWYHAFASRRPWRLLKAYAASTGVHALWNLAAVGVALPSLLLAGGPDDVLGQVLPGFALSFSLVLLVVLTISMVLGLRRLTRGVGQRPPEYAVLSQMEAPGSEVMDSASGDHRDRAASLEEDGQGL
jgi:RsiW-degrading membrane proteinase PrsW (M82 family)